MLIIVFYIALFAIYINFIGVFPRKEYNMKKEVMKTEIKNKIANEIKKEENTKKKILTCRMCG